MPHGAAQLHLLQQTVKAGFRRCGKADDVAHHEHAGTAQSAACQRLRHLPQIGQYLLLCGQAGVLDQGHGSRSRQSAGQQLLLDDAGSGDPM